VARRLGLADRDQPVTRTRYLMSADGAPVQLATSYEPDLGRPPAADAAGRAVTDRMRAIGIIVDQVVEEISVRPALSAEAAVLGLPAGAPVLVIDRAHQAGPRTVEVGEVVIAADRFRLRYRFPA
jgi:GntR family transcriptional regulator